MTGSLFRHHLSWSCWLSLQTCIGCGGGAGGNRLAAGADRPGARRPGSSRAPEQAVDASLTAKILDLPTGIARAMGDVHPLGNPHYWLDPENGRAIAKAVQAKLAQKDPAAPIAQRAADFDRRLSEAQQRWKSMIAWCKGRRGCNLPPIVGQLRRCVRHQRHRLCRAQAGHPADAAAHPGRHPGDARWGSS